MNDKLLDLENCAVISLPHINETKDNACYVTKLPSVREIIGEIRDHLNEPRFFSDRPFSVPAVRANQVQSIHKNQSKDVVKCCKHLHFLCGNLISNQKTYVPPDVSVPPESHFFENSCIKDDEHFSRSERQKKYCLNAKNIRKPTPYLLNAAKIVEATSKTDSCLLTGDIRIDEIIRSNGDYQMEIARVLESNSITFNLLEKWPLSQHSEDVLDKNNMELLIDLIPCTSIAMTLVEAQKVCEALKKIQIMKNKRNRALNKSKKLVSGIQRNREKVQTSSASSRNCESLLCQASLSKKLAHVDESPGLSKVSSHYPKIIDHSRNETIKRKEAVSGNRRFEMPRECIHCSCSETPEWRKGPYGSKNLCNACGLFYKKLLKKFGDMQADILIYYRRMSRNLDRRVPKTFDVPQDFLKEFDLDEARSSFSNNP